MGRSIGQDLEFHAFFFLVWDKLGDVSLARSLAKKEGQLVASWPL